MSESSILPTKGGYVVDVEGHRLGHISAIYEDQMTGTPEWVRVARRGLIRRTGDMVPLDSAVQEHNRLRVAYQASQIHYAPRVDPAIDSLDHQTEMRLFAYYRLQRTLPGDTAERDRRYAAEPAMAEQRLHKGA
jgi:hypothetical protein